MMVQVIRKKITNRFWYFEVQLIEMQVFVDFLWNRNLR